MQWLKSPDISRRINFLISHLGMDNVDPERIFCFTSTGSSSRAIARIWSLPKIWQQALSTGPGYCLEVISEKYDRLPPDQQEKVLIHELLHIPQSFSGSLAPHRNRHHRTYRHYQDRVNDLYNILTVKSYEKR
jgi:predicted metallopeptidase